MMISILMVLMGVGLIMTGYFSVSLFNNFLNWQPFPMFPSMESKYATPYKFSYT